MKKNFKSAILILAIVLLVFCLVACDNKDGSSESQNTNNSSIDYAKEYTFEYNETDDTYKVTSFDGYSTSVYFPETYNDKKVTTIGKDVFKKNNHVGSIYIPSSIITIENGAFSDCAQLKKIEFAKNDSLIIEDNAFRNSFELITYVGPKEIFKDIHKEALKTVNLTSGDTINFEDFSNCHVLTSVTLPTINKIEYGTFFNCTALDTIKFSDSLKTIEANAFTNTKVTKVFIDNLDKFMDIDMAGMTSNPMHNGATLYVGDRALTELTIPDGTTEIKANMFNGCKSIEKVTIPKTLKTININAFTGCTNLKKVYIDNINDWCDINFLSNPLYYAHNLYIDNSLVYELNIPNNLTHLKFSTFEGINVTNVNFPKSLKVIDQFAFRGAQGFSEVDLPDGLTTIYDSAFYNCKCIKNVKIPESVNYMGNAVFSGCSALLSINLPSSMDKIGSALFNGCSSLENIVIPENVKTIEQGAFSNCSKLNNVVLPNGVTEIGESAFRDCSSLNFLKPSKDLKKIGKNAFKGCYTIIDIVLNDTVEYIGSGAFSGCVDAVIYTSLSTIPANWAISPNLTRIPVVTNYGGTKGTSQDGFRWTLRKDNSCVVNGYVGNLTNITIPNEISGYNVTEIVNNSFANKVKLKEIIVSEGIEKIGNYAFLDCKGLKNIKLATTLTDIGAGAFKNCIALPSIKVYDNVKSIGASAFDSCTSLQQIRLPARLDEISNSMFNGCIALESVVIPGNVVSIGDNAFQDCKKLTNINIPSNTQYIGVNAFYGCSHLINVLLPASVTVIGDNAFSSCDVLFVYCEAQNKPDGWSNNWIDYHRPVIWGMEP